jgi:hypothetical protein
VLSVGRKTRTISPALRRALKLRDKGCRFPGCCQTRHNDGHHIQYWVDGGETELDNLVTLCRFHHTLIHRELFKVRREDDGGFTFLRANGSVVPQAPRQPRGDCIAVTEANAKRGVAPDHWTLYPKEAQPRAELGWSISSLLESRTARRE